MLYCTAYRDHCKREPTESNSSSAGIREDSDRTERMGNNYRYGRYRGYEREYQGCIHISGTYPYETTEYMGLCVSMESAIETGEWSPGMYKLYYESEGKYWEAKSNEKESKTDE